MSKHYAQPENKKLVLSIRDVLDEKQLLEPLRNYSEMPLESLISYLYESHYRNKDENEVYRTVKKDSFLKTKRRWVKATLKNLETSKAPNKELRAKVQFFKKYIQKFGKNEFKKEFKVESIEDYVEKSRTELEEWASNEAMPIHSYPFFAEKTARQHKTAIQTDLLMVIGEFLINNTSFFKPTVYQSPNIAINTSFFGVSKRGKIQLDGELVSNIGDDMNLGKEYYPAVLKNNSKSNKNINIMVSKDFVNDLNRKVPDLDAKDFELFIDVLNHRDASFQASRRIQFPLKELVNQLYGSDGSKNYEMTIQRLLKLANYRITESNENGEYLVKGLFSSVKILNDTKDKTGEKIVTAFVSEDVYDDYLRQQVVNIYSDKVKELKGHYAYHLVFVLQKERLQAFQTKEPNPVKRKWIDFGYSIRFNRRTKKENLEEFEEAVRLIKEQQFLIEDYYRSGEYYFFTFFPLNELELENDSVEPRDFIG